MTAPAVITTDIARDPAHLDDGGSRAAWQRVHSSRGLGYPGDGPAEPRVIELAA